MEKRNKILSICLPTYNRSQCIGEQLHRLSLINKDVLENIEIIVSDNGSSDDTKIVVESYLELLDFTYVRNKENIGPDANFYNCLMMAHGQYAWLLGDDDFLEYKKIKDLLYELGSGDYGLVHISSIKKNLPVKIFTNIEDFLLEIDVYITFMSGNIINMKYFRLLDLSTYIGSFFLQVPLYINSAIHSNKNCIIYDKMFDVNTVNENGGYNIFEVFVKNYLSIFHDFLINGRISKSLYHKEMKISKKFVIPYFYIFFVKKETSNFKTGKELEIMYDYFGRWETWSSVVKFVLRNITFKIIYKLKMLFLSSKNI